MKKITSFLLVALIALAMTSCAKWQAQHQINALESLVEKIENHGDELTRQDWQEVSDKYEAICTKINQYDYTNEQLKEIGRLKGRYYVAYAKGALNSEGGLLNGLFQQGSGLLDGVLGGVSDAIDDVLDDISDEQEDEEMDEDLKELESLFD